MNKGLTHFEQHEGKYLMADLFNTFFYLWSKYIFQIQIYLFIYLLLLAINNENNELISNPKYTVPSKVFVLSFTSVKQIETQHNKSCISLKSTVIVIYLSVS